MGDEIADLKDEYDDLLMRLNAGTLSLDASHRIQIIEDDLARRFGYDWSQQFLRDGCDCGAETTGKWADKHDAGCAVLRNA